MNANVKAAALTTELFDLLGKFGHLRTHIYSVAHDHDAAHEFGSAVANLASAYERLKNCELVIDAARDEKDQDFAFE
jgi:hypothetical protein